MGNHLGLLVGVLRLSSLYTFMSHVVTSRRCQQPISGPETVTRLSGWLSSDDVTILSYVVILVIGGLFK